MSCPYYTYKGHYYCIKQEKDVDTDLYYKYCRNYDYGDCPIYKHETSSGGCFLTSACVEAKGLPDDCHELTVLRSFRDGYLSSLPTGKEEIAEYYHVAPAIVEAIKKQDNALSIFNGIYEQLVLPCVQHIEAGENEQAHALYRNAVGELSKQFPALS